MAFEKIKRLWRSDRADAQPALSPALSPATQTITGIGGTGAAHMGVLSGTDGRESLVWARYDARPFSAGYMSGWQPFYGNPGSEISRERAVVSSVTLDLLHSNPVIATLVEGLATYGVGNGFTLSSRPNAAALGISDQAARALADEIEKAWSAWASNPAECDSGGRFNLHQLALQAYKSYLLTGETLAIFDWQKAAGATTRTKLKLLDVRQLDQSITRVLNGGSIMQGVEFDRNGRQIALWIRPAALGSFNVAPQAVRIPTRTPWGRQRAILLLDAIAPNQIRGMSPLAPSLTPAHSKNTLREFTLIQNLVQSQSATTVESDLPRDVAMNALKTNDPSEVLPGSAGPQQAGSNAAAEWMAAAGPYYEKVKVALEPGKVVHMMKGDRLVMHRAESPNNTYDPFDKSMTREAAKAAGSSYEDASGDYSATSFSASRMAAELPWRINTRRRAAIAERLYQETFRCWLEEQCETGRIVLPKGAPAFWEASDAYSHAVWRGSSKPVADPLKAAQADILEIENGLATLESKLGERGFDLEEVIAQRASERDQLIAAGLPYPVPKNRDDFEPEDDKPPT